jgi:hypothetical protein
MSEHKPGTARPQSPAVVSRSFGAESALLESLPFILVSDANDPGENRQASGIKATSQSIQIVRQLIEYIKNL